MSSRIQRLKMSLRPSEMVHQRMQSSTQTMAIMMKMMMPIDMMILKSFCYPKRGQLIIIIIIITLVYISQWINATYIIFSEDPPTTDVKQIKSEVECHKSAVWRCGHILLRIHKFFDYLNPRESFQPRCAVRNVSYYIYARSRITHDYYMMTGILQLSQGIQREITLFDHQKEATPSPATVTSDDEQSKVQAEISEGPLEHQDLSIRLRVLLSMMSSN